MSHHGCPERLSSRSKNYVEDGSGQATMEVLVETLTGTAFEMTVSPTDTVFAIKSKIFRVEGIPVSQQHLVYGHRELEDSRTLRSLRIGAGAKLRLVLSMRGGPISTRRLPPPPSHQPDKHWRDIERLLDANREENPSWSGSSSAPGCKVTVLVFRDGDKLNMLRVRDNQDGTYSPLATENYSSSLKSLVEETCDDSLSGSVAENAVTMGKMMELRRRMEALTLTRRPTNDNMIQKTRSEESLSLCRDDVTYHYDTSFHDHFATLPPIGSRSESDRSVCDSDRYKLSECLSGAALVKRPRDHVSPLSHHYGPLLCRSPGLSELLSSSSPSLERPSLAPPGLARHPPSDRLHHLGDLHHLRHLDGGECGAPPRSLEVGSERRQRRIQRIAQLDQHRLFSYESLDLPRVDSAPELPDVKPIQKPIKKRLRCTYCNKRLSIATVHTCRCGNIFCPPHRYAEVHDCTYDYKAQAQNLLQRDNPVVSAPKLPKI